MKKFFIKNGSTLTTILVLFFLVMDDLMSEYLPEFSNKYLTLIIYFLIAIVPLSLSIYYNNKK
jgi:hypothetical protein|tara:strand:- start:140 stop:328 length:189 start_codon:yes stop_codon:yes gene_type:complete